MDMAGEKCYRQYEQLLASGYSISIYAGFCSSTPAKVTPQFCGALTWTIPAALRSAAGLGWISASLYPDRSPVPLSNTLQPTKWA